MNSPRPEALHSLHAGLSTEYAETRAMVKVGRVIPLNDLLRQMLARIADGIQSALDDWAEVTEDDLAMLCVAEVKARIAARVDYMLDYYLRYHCARTLFEWSRGMLVGHAGCA